MKLNTLLKPWLNTTLTYDIKGIHHDSREILPGFLFLAYPGQLTDGRHYIKQAQDNGCIAIVYDPEHWPVDYPKPDASSAIELPHLAKLLPEISQRFYHNSSEKLMVVGVTGTNGKTTIAYQLAQAYTLLNQPAAYIGTLGCGQVDKLQPTVNTTPDALVLQKLCYDYHCSSITVLCLEVSSHALAQQRVKGIAFDQAIFTNLTQDHLDYHQTMENYAQAKAKLFAYDSLAWAIVNNDDSYAYLMKAAVKNKGRLLTFGINQSSDIQALSYSMMQTATHMVVKTPGGICEMTIQALGLFNVYNALAVVASLVACGYQNTAISSVITQLKPAPGRMERVVAEPCVIVDYAHTPDALEKVLQTLKEIKQAQLIVVFGCGGERDTAKRPTMGKIASELADSVIITSDNPRTEAPDAIIDDIIAGLVNSKKNYLCIIDRRQAIHHALSQAQAQDIVLIAGKGHENYQQIGHEKLFFCDKLTVQNYYRDASFRR